MASPSARRSACDQVTVRLPCLAKGASGSCAAAVSQISAKVHPDTSLTSVDSCGCLTGRRPRFDAVLEGKSGPGTCGKAANDYGLCPEARCRACAGTARNDCTSSAFGDGSACKAYEKPLQDCLAGSSIPQADLQNKCGLVTPALGTEEWFKRLGKTFCG